MIPKPKRAVLNRTQRQISYRINRIKHHINSKAGTTYSVNRYEFYKMRVSVLTYQLNNSADYQNI